VHYSFSQLNQQNCEVYTKEKGKKASHRFVQIFEELERIYPAESNSILLCLYSIGLPLEILGLSCLSEKELEFVYEFCGKDIERRLRFLQSQRCQDFAERGG